MKSMKRVISTILCIIILTLSPMASYIDATSVTKVYAAEVVVPVVVEGGTLAMEYLVAFFGTLGLEETIRNHPQETAEAFNSYVKSHPDNIANAGNQAILLYGPQAIGEAVSSISWDEISASLENYHDAAVDDLTGIYMKVCPELLGSFESFVDSVITGETYIEGVSEVVKAQSFTGYDSIQNEDLTYNVSGYASFVSEKWGDFRECVYTGVAAYGKPFAILSGSTYLLKYMDANGVYHTLSINSQWYQDGKAGNASSTSVIGTSECTTITTNIPVFNSLDEALAAFASGVFSSALNYAKSMYDTITDNNDLPFWDVDELWERVARANDCGIAIGAYGDGIAVGANDWADDIPWVDVGALSDWADVIDRTLDGILSGTIDMPLDIPDNPTYVDVWEDVIDRTWDDVITDNPAIPVDPDVPIDPDIPIDQPVTEVIELDTTLPSMPSALLPLAGELKHKFPFSIPWDLQYLFEQLSGSSASSAYSVTYYDDGDHGGGGASRPGDTNSSGDHGGGGASRPGETQAPRWVIPVVVGSAGIHEELVIDLKDFQAVSDISRTLLSVLFCVCLMKFTIKIVEMRKEE